jgi:hypothetical protein
MTELVPTSKEEVPGDPDGPDWRSCSCRKAVFELSPEREHANELEGPFPGT